MPIRDKKKSNGCVPPCAQLQILSARVDDLVDLKADVKVILQKTTDIEVHLAKVPLFSDLEPMKSRLTVLEGSRMESKGGWKVLAIAGSALAGLGGAIGGVVQYILRHEVSVK